MFNSSKFSPALKGGARPLPVPASGPGNPSSLRVFRWRVKGTRVVYETVAATWAEVKVYAAGRAGLLVRDNAVLLVSVSALPVEICGLQFGGLVDVEGCSCADRAACNSSCTANF